MQPEEAKTVPVYKTELERTELNVQCGCSDVAVTHSKFKSNILNYSQISQSGSLVGSVKTDTIMN